MSVPIRRPDFQAEYPTHESFERAMTQFESIAEQGSAIASPSGRTGTARGRPYPPDEKSLLQLWSVREMSSLLLRLADARIVSEHEGLVDTLLLSVPKVSDPAATGRIDERTTRHLRSLLNTFGDPVTYIIVVARDQMPEMAKLVSDARVTRVSYVQSPYFKVSIWAQDAYVAMRDRSGHAILCEGIVFNRAEDMSIADDVAEQTQVDARQSYLYFQGGNVLGGADLTLIGRDYAWRNAGRFGISDETEAKLALAAEFGTPVLGLGERTDPKHKPLYDRGIMSGFGLQPIFHIDMYVSRTGVKGKSGKEIVFLGRPAAAKTVTGSYSDIPELDTPLYDSFFDPTAAQLAAHFEVRTLPLWNTFGNLRDPSKRQKFYNLTWNNSIVENDGKTKRVLLPDYTDPTDARIFGVDLAVRRDLQSAARQAWEDIGFTVRFTESMEDLAWGDGAVHCITKTLRRTT